MRIVKLEVIDGNSYVGEIRSGFIEVGGVRAPAENLVNAYVTSDTHFDRNDKRIYGHFELLDGTRLVVEQLWGLLGPRKNCTGEICIYVESLGKQIAVPVTQVTSISPHENYA